MHKYVPFRKRKDLVKANVKRIGAFRYIGPKGQIGPVGKIGSKFTTKIRLAEMYLHHKKEGKYSVRTV